MKVLALRQIKHNGQVYEKGDEFVTDNDKQADDLVRLESAKIVEAPTARKLTKAEKSKTDKKASKKSVKTAKKKSGSDSAVEVANMKPKMTMRKTVLVGIARARGLTVKKTVTRNEAFSLVKEDREERGDLDKKALKSSDN